jgi:hypothetical protein
MSHHVDVDEEKKKKQDQNKPVEDAQQSTTPAHDTHAADSLVAQLLCSEGGELPPGFLRPSSYFTRQQESLQMIQDRAIAEMLSMEMNSSSRASSSYGDDYYTRRTRALLASLDDVDQAEVARARRQVEQDEQTNEKKDGKGKSKDGEGGSLWDALGDAIKSKIRAIEASLSDSQEPLQRQDSSEGLELQSM